VDHSLVLRCEPVVFDENTNKVARDFEPATVVIASQAPVQGVHLPTLGELLSFVIAESQDFLLDRRGHAGAKPCLVKIALVPVQVRDQVQRRLSIAIMDYVNGVCF
jgi:hypothetical protein